MEEGFILKKNLGKELTTSKEYFFVEIIFNDKHKFLLGKTLTITSKSITTFLRILIEFQEAEDKLDFSNRNFNGFWQDHFYPDKIIEDWTGVDTTKNNLGLLSNIIAFEFGPITVYSHTLQKIYIIEELNYKLLADDNRIPEIFEMELIDFVETLKWWSNICNAPDS